MAGLQCCLRGAVLCDGRHLWLWSVAVDGWMAVLLVRLVIVAMFPLTM